MEYKIRPVESGDAPALAHIQTESWKAAFAKLLPEEVLRSATQVPPAEQMYRKLLAEQFGHGLMMEVDGAPHCMAWWSASRDPECPGDAEIICIHSLPGNWGRGYGSAMMDRLLADIRRAGYRRVMLWVFRDNVRARGFYEKKGFVCNGRTQPSFGIEEVCYERKLPADAEQ